MMYPLYKCSFNLSLNSLALTPRIDIFVSSANILTLVLVRRQFGRLLISVKKSSDLNLNPEEHRIFMILLLDVVFFCFAYLCPVSYIIMMNNFKSVFLSAIRMRFPETDSVMNTVKYGLVNNQTINCCPCDLISYSQANLREERGEERNCSFYSANVYLVRTITRNSMNLFYNVRNTPIRFLVVKPIWPPRSLYLCIADALSSPSFQISGADTKVTA